ncbi:MAG: hypothetical protein JSW67_12335 [Candidatus Latescibacterota bacterium]|nr:MAG: hypothetical protein JSW67_12335 [Candidatus Latescibacterota bacterium]
MPFRLTPRTADRSSVTWTPLRSRRDPAFWAPFLVLLLVLAPLTVWGHAWVSAWLDRLRETAVSNPEAARAEAVRGLRLWGAALCAVSIAFSAYLLRYSQLGLRQGRLPPSGWWSLGAYQVAVGPSARRMSRFVRVLALFLLAAALAFLLALEFLLRVLQQGT